MARSRRACPEPAEGTPAMLVGRCSSELSSHKLQAKSKKSQAPSAADLSRHAVEGSAVPQTLPGNVFRPPSAGRKYEGNDKGAHRTHETHLSSIEDNGHAHCPH